MEIETRIDRVSMVPGRSTVFGMLGGKPIFNLPGSPTASLVAFEELVRPSLVKMRGSRGDAGFLRPTIKMSLDGSIRGKRDLRKYVLASIHLVDAKFRAVPIPKRRRGALTPGAQANGMIILAEGALEALAGQEVDVRLIDLGV
jgi:molybdopterin biosynthesis enzyme